MIASEIAREYAAALDNKFANHKITTTGGRKYDRIVTVANHGGKSVHAFVERETGLLYKAAGWPGPATGARYDLSNPESFMKTVKDADPYGGYLYR